MLEVGAHRDASDLDSDVNIVPSQLLCVSVSLSFFLVLVHDGQGFFSVAFMQAAQLPCSVLASVAWLVSCSVTQSILQRYLGSLCLNAPALCHVNDSAICINLCEVGIYFI